jgi:hypothetical protein
MLRGELRPRCHFAFAPAIAERKELPAPIEFVSMGAGGFISSTYYLSS